MLLTSGLLSSYCVVIGGAASNIELFGDPVQAPGCARGCFEPQAISCLLSLSHACRSATNIK